jgi:hypothetical protein
LTSSRRFLNAEGERSARVAANLMSDPHLALVSMKLLLQVGLSIDCPTESAHKRFELPVAMCAYSNGWSRTEPFYDSEPGLLWRSSLPAHQTESLHGRNDHINGA